MTFDEKVKALRNIPIFKVLPISEVKDGEESNFNNYSALGFQIILRFSQAL